MGTSSAAATERHRGVPGGILSRASPYCQHRTTVNHSACDISGSPITPPPILNVKLRRQGIHGTQLNRSCPSAMAPPTPSSYRPRKKRKLQPLSPSASNDLILEPGSSRASPAFPLVSFLWAARGGTSQWLILPLILMTAGLFRWAVGLWGYSGGLQNGPSIMSLEDPGLTVVLGFQTPPMHGDFEAQRHWMELTSHLPVSKWYWYDLQYWGLDYPPLTAYHSLLLGKMYVL